MGQPGQQRQLGQPGQPRKLGHPGQLRQLGTLFTKLSDSNPNYNIKKANCFFAFCYNALILSFVCVVNSLKLTEHLLILKTREPKNIQIILVLCKF